MSVGLSPDDRWWQERADITRVEGGASRAHSVLALLQSLAGIATESDWIWVHDAVRPCFSKTLVDSIHNALDDNAGAIIPGLPVTDTLKKVDREGRVQGTLDREGVYSVQTPQVCRYGLLLDALQQAMKKQAAVTDESMAMELAGHPVVLLRGDENNIKVTRPGDLIRVNEILCGVQAI